MPPMNPDDTYQTLASVSQASYRDKASKFIAIASPAGSEEEVREILLSLKKKYYDANHHCYAYRIGYENPMYRVNDDGEPSGSAGKPIYGQILSKGLTNVLVVVIRYFGGTKLGIPGLIQAYKTAARDALNDNAIVTRTIDVHFKAIFPYPAMSPVMKILKEDHVSITSQELDNDCAIGFSVRKSMEEKIRSQLERIAGLKLIFEQQK